jgi:hypothetical protein
MTREVDIEAIGVWDTVGALGVPTMPFLRKVGWPDFLHEYKFYDTRVDTHIRHAFHALALDEQRVPYSPTLWEGQGKVFGQEVTTKVKQVWFPGVHSNVGGSYDDTGMADITLAWMMSQLSPWIDFKKGYIAEQHRLNQLYNSNLKPPLKRGWGLGRIYQSAVMPQSLAGTAPRTPGQYHRVDWLTGKTDPTKPLEDTHEYAHASVRVRTHMKGMNYEDSPGPYSPKALQSWRLTGKPFPANLKMDSGEANEHKWAWVYQGSDSSMANKFLFEDELGIYEKELLDADPDALEMIHTIPPKD